MDWSRGFSASCYAMLVDPATWRDTQRVEITGGSVSRSSTGLRQSADLACREWQPTRERWVRVYLDAAQAGQSEHVALFTGLTSVPETAIDGNRTSYPVACYSVLKPAEDILLPRGWFAGEGLSAGDIMAELLSVTPAPVSVAEGAPALRQAIIAESGENRLTMTEKILSAIGWQLTIDGDGTIRIGPPETEIRAVFGVDNDVVEPQVSLKADWFACPNCFRAIYGDQTAEARDDDEDSMLSTINRGREIWAEESGVQLGDGEGLEQYAARRLRELQAYAYTVRYDRRFDPAVNVGSVIRLHYPGQNLMDEYRVTAQSITLGLGARTSEEVQR